MAEPKTSGRPALVALARSYVPEWRFDEKNPDSGSAVALLVDDLSLIHISTSRWSAERRDETWQDSLLSPT